MLRILCVRYYDDFGIVLPECLIKTVLNIFTSFNTALFAILEEGKSEFGALLERLGLAGSFRDDGGHVIASLSLAKEKAQELVGLIREPANQQAASLARLQKLAGRLRLAQAAAMGRFGRAALRPIYELIAQGGQATARVQGMFRLAGASLPRNHAALDFGLWGPGRLRAFPNLLRRHWGRKVS